MPVSITQVSDSKNVYATSGNGIVNTATTFTILPYSAFISFADMLQQANSGFTCSTSNGITTCVLENSYCGQIQKNLESVTFKLHSTINNKDYDFVMPPASYMRNNTNTTECIAGLQGWANNTSTYVFG